MLRNKQGSNSSVASGSKCVFLTHLDSEPWETSSMEPPHWQTEAEETDWICVIPLLCQREKSNDKAPCYPWGELLPGAHVTSDHVPLAKVSHISWGLGPLSRNPGQSFLHYCILCKKIPSQFPILSVIIYSTLYNIMCLFFVIMFPPNFLCSIT